jgi:hypothetical protein
MKSLLMAHCLSLTKLQRRDVGEWAEIYKLINAGINHVDRMGRLQMPFRFGLYEKFRLPARIDGFSESYEDCCWRRAEEIARLQEEKQVPIALLYSGGIDSTAVLVSFAKLLGNRLKERLTVFLSPESIQENPEFYFSFIRTNCRIESSERFSSLFDRSHIVVSGELNDQLFGSDIVGTLARHEPFEKIAGPYSREIVVRFFKHSGMSETAANAWFDLLDGHARQAPCAVETVHDFFWWLNFVFKWQCVYFRTLLRIDPAQQKNIDESFLDGYYRPFFCTTEFQKWSMANPDLKVQKSWRTYKFPAKRLIYEFNRDERYLNYKTKTASLYRLFLQKHNPVAITSDFEFLHELVPEDWYVEDNSFRRAEAPGAALQPESRIGN